MLSEEDRERLSGRRDAGLRVVARLLWAGVASGLLLGAIAGAVLGWADDVSYTAGASAVGGMVGCIAGVAVQALNAALLTVARRATRPRPTTHRLLLVPLPTLAAGLLTWSVAGTGGTTPGTLAFVLAAACVAAAVAWSAAPWCLAPVADARP